MTEMIFASQNGRNIPKEDKIFGISSRAKKMAATEGKDKVVNATIGALLDDNGKLIVMSSVDRVFRSLEPDEYAQYAPIGGTPGFKEAAKKDLFRDFVPQCYVEAVSTPGGTGAIRNAISNYTSHNDKILTTDWYWAPYKTIAEEQERKLDTFEIFDHAGNFNTEGLAQKAAQILKQQDRLLIILNTPSHNPTGYGLTPKEWEDVIAAIEEAGKGKKVTLLVDAAYIDFAGDEKESRSFLPMLEKACTKTPVLIAHSLSKSYTLYGMRCGALVCMTSSADIAEEFKTVCEFSSRASWSNCPKAPQVILTKIYENPKLLENVMEERKQYRDMLIRRGVVFKEEAARVGLVTLPFRSGFFMSVPCKDPEKSAALLENEGIFTVPLAKGIRIAGSSITEKDCKRLPEAIKRAIDNI